MRLHLVLAATLAASFVVGCSGQKSTSPPPKALASAGPIAKPVRLSHETTGAPPPKADPPPAPAVASLPAQNQDPPEATPPPAPPDPYESLDVRRVPTYEKFENLLVATVNKAVAAHRALRQLLFKGDPTGMPEEIQIRLAMVKLGEYEVSFKPEAEKRLRAFLVDANGKEPEARKYLAVVDYLLLAGQEKARILAAVYERMLDSGADIPVDARNSTLANA